MLFSTCKVINEMPVDAKTVISIVIEAIAFVLTVIGNLIVIYAVTRGNKLQKKSNIYILSIAVADLMVGLVAIPVGLLNVSAGLQILKKKKSKFTFNSQSTTGRTITTNAWFCRRYLRACCFHRSFH